MVITEINADTAALSAFSALSNSKMRIMQVMQMFFLTAKTTFIRWLPRAFLALLHGLIFFFRCRYDTLPPGIFDTLAL